MTQSSIMYDRAAAKSEKKPYGIVYRMRKWSPFQNQHIYTTDFKLARTVLLGDKGANISESVKQNTLASFNFADRTVSNLFT